MDHLLFRPSWLSIKCNRRDLSVVRARGRARFSSARDTGVHRRVRGRMAGGWPPLAHRVSNGQNDWHELRWFRGTR